MKTLAIYCAGGFGGVTLELALELNQNMQWAEIIYVDDAIIEEQHAIPVLSFQSIQRSYTPENLEFVIAAGEPRIRERLYTKVKRYGYSLANLISPQAKANKFKSIGEGNIILAFAYISSSQVQIGDNNIIMPFTQISHNSILGDHCVLASSVNLSGGTIIENRVYFGTGAKCREYITVGHDAIIGMGAVVTESIEAEAVMVGFPAKMVRKNAGKVFH